MIIKYMIYHNNSRLCIVNVPNLRFPQYKGNWAKETLDNIASFHKGKGISKDEISITGNECILYGELYTTYKSEIIDKVISKTESNYSGLFYSKKNDIIIPSSGETAIDIATARYIVNDNVLLGGDLNVIRLKNANGAFFSYQLNGIRKKDIAEISQGSSIVHLHNKDLMKLHVFYPESLKEQEKIVSFLSKIDLRINSQNKIIKVLKVNKKMISNILIFKNKNLNKQIKINDIGKIKNGFSFKSNLYSDIGKYKIITITNVTGNRHIDSVKCNKLFNLPPDLQKHHILSKNDILISLTGNVGRVSIVNEENCLLNQRVGVLDIKNKDIQEYIFQVLSTKKFENLMILKSQGAAQKNIGNEDIENYSFPYSNNTNYIKLISNVLHIFDKKIALEEKLLESYLKQKNYLLKNLFI